MENGKVLFFNSVKGWGFIEGNGKSYFVHHTAINMPGFRTLEPGQLVSFDTEEGDPRGLKAINVLVLEEAEENESGAE